MRKISTFLFLLAIGQLFGQSKPGLWTVPTTVPSQFEQSTFPLDFGGMNEALRHAPLESKVGIRSSACVIELPNMEGRTEKFRVVESPVMPDVLAKKYPDIHTFNVESMERPAVWGKLDIGPNGLHACVFEPGRTYLVEPVEIGVLGEYKVYDRKTLPLNRPEGAKIILPDGGEMPLDYLPGEAASPRGNIIDPVSLRRFRFALSTTGEYATKAGGTKAKTMAEVVKAVNRFNGIFERDFAMHFDLVANEDTLIFLDATTDPFNPANVPLMAQFNKDVTDLRIGPANYDIGHVFGVYVSGSVLGIAGGHVCSENKAKACSTDPNPLSDNFIVTVCQEVEHQFSARHTWNRCGDPSGGLANQYHDESAFEPGSGSTIVSYGGSCGTDDVVSAADDYNHGWNIQQVVTDLVNGEAATCAVVEATSNNRPTASHNYQDGFFIPISTPFRLTGTGSDPEDAGLTYLWEQMDLGPQSPLGQPQGSAPLFRSYPAKTTGTRVFPAMNFVINNLTTKNEILPTTDRPMTFRLTVLDNHPAFGGTDYKEVAFKATTEAGPFRVTSPNTNGVNWKIGEFLKINWDVANTKGGKVNCSKVNVKLSTDGGNNYPTTLAANVDNDGLEYIQVPNLPSTTCRVMVEAADNIFFDLSNFNHSIAAATAEGFSTAPFPDNGAVCLPATFVSTFKTAALGGFAGQVTFAFSGLPAGATASFDNATVNAGADAKLTINCPAGVAEGTYGITVTATSSTGATVTHTVNITVVANDFSALALLAPVDGDGAASSLPTFTWNTVADADSYDWQLDETPAFNSANLQSKTGLTTGSTTPLATLADGKQYFWRVRPLNACGAGDWVGPFSLFTQKQSCTEFESTSAFNIAAGGTPTIDSKITSTFSGILSDVNLTQMTGNHENYKDLDARLIGPSGTEVILFKNKCGATSTNFKFGIDDQAAINFTCPPNDGLLRKTDATAGNALANFNGQQAAGSWTLRIKDQTSGSGGTLTGWKLQLCGAGASNPPVLVNKNPATVAAGGNVAIGNDKLKCTDPNNTAAQLVYTVVKPTAKGELRLNWATVLGAGSQFTQADLDNGSIRYFHYGSASGDSFTFTVVDGEGGFIGTPQFDINLDPTAVGEAQGVDFQLLPNPARDEVTLVLGSAESEFTMEIAAATGQLLRSEHLAAGVSSRRVSLAGLPSGVYFVTLKSAGRMGVQRLVKE